MRSPFAIVTEKFGDKTKLVAAVEKFTDEDLWLARTNKAKGLKHVSNAKLLKLHATFSAVKEKFGTRAKLVDAIVELEKRAKDEGFKARLLAYPVPRLWDMYSAGSKRSAGSAKAAAKAEAAPKAGAKKAASAAATKPAAKKAPAVTKPAATKPAAKK